MTKKKLKNPKHDRILSNFEEEKQKHLKYLATKMLKRDELNQHLKTKRVNPDFLNEI